jgi:cell division protein FtsB
MVNTVFQQRRYRQYKDIPVIPHAHDDTKEELIKFDILKKNVLETLETYAIFFRDGEFYELRDGINNIDPLSEFMIRTENFELSHKEYTNYEFEDDLVEQYKSFLFIIVDEFKQILQLTTQNDSLQQQVDTLQESDRTLKNLDLLKEFVKKYYGGMSSSLFSVDYTLSEPLKISEEVLIYLRQYGPPDGGIFETEKMARIKMELYGTTVSDSSSGTNQITKHEDNHTNKSTNSTKRSHSVYDPLEEIDRKIERLKLKLENENCCSMTKMIEKRIYNLEARKEKMNQQCDSSI